MALISLAFSDSSQLALCRVNLNPVCVSWDGAGTVFEAQAEPMLACMPERRL